MDRNNDTKGKPARNRSCAYPALALFESIELAQKIFDGLGPGPHERKTLSKGLGYSSFSGAVSGKVGSLVQFGLLERFRGGYSITARAKEIFTYPEETSEPAIREAAMRPALYQKITDKFAGKPMPGNLAAVLAAGYGITEKAAGFAAANFIKTMEFAGLLKDGVLILPQIGEDAGLITVAGGKKLPGVVAGRDEEEEQIKIPLPSGPVVLFPKSMAYRLSLGEFAQELKNLDRKAGGASEN